jgi:hypothetical protein
MTCFAVDRRDDDGLPSVSMATNFTTILHQTRAAARPGFCPNAPKSTCRGSGKTDAHAETNVQDSSYEQFLVGMSPNTPVSTRYEVAKEYRCEEATEFRFLVSAREVKRNPDIDPLENDLKIPIRSWESTTPALESP